jgi:5-methylcytosine-specific restriction endonuclease McrA
VPPDSIIKLVMKHGYAKSNEGPPTHRTFKTKKGRKNLRAFLFGRDPLCCWCRKPLNQKLATIEHMVRRSDGGGMTRQNCKLACFWCNNSRGDSDDPAEIVRRGQRAREVAARRGSQLIHQHG